MTIGPVTLSVLPAGASASRVECEEINPRRGICEVVFAEDKGERNALRARVANGEVTFSDRVVVRPDRSHRVVTRMSVVSRDRAGRRTVRVARVPFLIDSERGIE